MTLLKKTIYQSWCLKMVGNMVIMLIYLYFYRLVIVSHLACCFFFTYWCIYYFKKIENSKWIWSSLSWLIAADIGPSDERQQTFIAQLPDSDSGVYHTLFTTVSKVWERGALRDADNQSCWCKEKADLTISESTVFFCPHS